MSACLFTAVSEVSKQGHLSGRPLVNSGQWEGGRAGPRKEGGRKELMKEQQEGRGVLVKVAKPVKTCSGLPLALETSDDILPGASLRPC